MVFVAPVLVGAGFRPRAPGVQDTSQTSKSSGLAGGLTGGVGLDGAPDPSVPTANARRIDGGVGTRHVHRTASLPPPAGVRIHLLYDGCLDLPHAQSQRTLWKSVVAHGRARHRGVRDGAHHTHAIRGAANGVRLDVHLCRGGTVPKRAGRRAVLGSPNFRSVVLAVSHPPAGGDGPATLLCPNES